MQLKCTAFPLQSRSGQEDSRNLNFPDFISKAQDDGKFISFKHRPSLLQEMLLVLISVFMQLDSVSSWQTILR